MCVCVHLHISKLISCTSDNAELADLCTSLIKISCYCFEIILQALNDIQIILNTELKAFRCG